uniref:Uncharacterized protein n=1 Tax=Glossina brevipalpis TaxID=37001 RepID=A0A1A9WF95_9MUSC
MSVVYKRIAHFVLGITAKTTTYISNDNHENNNNNKNNSSNNNNMSRTDFRVNTSSDYVVQFQFQFESDF